MARAHLELTTKAGADTDAVEAAVVTMARKVRLLDLTTKDGEATAAVEADVTVVTRGPRAKVRAQVLRPKAGVATDAVEEVVVDDTALLALMDLGLTEALTMVLPALMALMDTATTAVEDLVDEDVDGEAPGDAAAHSAVDSTP
jgi:hypothetical protein